MSDTNPKSILVIDDDITSLDLVSFLFEERGYRVERCADGFSAIDFVRDNAPNLIIVDLMMPKINGVDTVAKIRELGLKVPIIAFTAVDEPELHAAAEQAGCDRILTKPCRPQRLLEQINSLLALPQ